jgi:hypothetical protein
VTARRPHAEAIAVGWAFAKALGWEAETTRLGFVFRWTKLRGRELAPWSNSGVIITAYGVANDDELTTYVELSLDTCDDDRAVGGTGHARAFCSVWRLQIAPHSN